ncbi:MAG: hypothetical protein JXR77_06560 [Lentisphaeria bacterium]|nr:hypothetical protein [Lentisphaeria bacterium]
MRHLEMPVMGLACILAAAGGMAPRDCGAAEAPVTLGIEAEDFQFHGDWTFQAGVPGTSGRGFLFAGPAGASLPAATAVEVPRAGQYSLWVRAMDFPDDRPGIRRFTVSLGGTRSGETFGDSGKPDFSWEPGGEFHLPAGPLLLGIHDVDHCYGRMDAVLLTTDTDFVPTLPLGNPGHPRTRPSVVPMPPEIDPLHAPPLQDLGDAPKAVIENEWVRIAFVPARRGEVATLAPRLWLRAADTWVDAAADADAEAYVVVRGEESELHYAGFFPVWRGAPRPAIAAEAGGARLETATEAPEAIWNAGVSARFLPRSARVENSRVRLDFHPSAVGTLAATWELRPGERAARVRLAFTAAEAGQYALGYHLFQRRPLSEIEELLLPMMWHRRRLPARPYTLLQPFLPTPIALAQTAGANGPLSWALIGDPSEIPFAWPDRREPTFGMLIRDLPGRVQPSIYGPVPGTERARAVRGDEVRFSFRVLVQPGDWYAGFRTAADQVFGLRDYRTNVRVSLSDAVLNMIDLVKDDQAGGWWSWPKGPYQIESRNGVTHASPLTYLSLYRLTGDEDLYRRRTLPALEFTFSRSHAHFSPTPDDTGRYPAGDMAGPIRLYGTTTFGGLWETANRRTPAFRDIALPADGIRVTAGYSHAHPFEEWLARHRLTGADEALQQARELADRYLEEHVRTPPSVEISPQPFFNLTFVPNWEGLLRLYEETGERRYLDGAVFGARQLMTGIWTQPVIPEGEIVVHPGDVFQGDVPQHIWWRGPDQYRLGFPRRPGDVAERRVPAWVPSNVGLGFEQPITYTSGHTGCRMIYQSAFSANFLRLAAYTGDGTFETYARNAVLGRFANYPGYYVTGFTDLPLDPRYPYDGPDLSCIYYHHIPAHLAWTLDYLVAELALRSEGRVSFPSQRQFGYAWFDSRTYGHAPGRVYDAENAWLWLRRGVVSVDQTSVNTLLAHNGHNLFVALMNENNTPEQVTVDFSPDLLGVAPGSLRRTEVLRNNAPAEPLALAQDRGTVTVPGRGLVVLSVPGVHIDVPTHRRFPVPDAGPHPAGIEVPTDAGFPVRAAVIQVLPGPWDAYVWCAASPQQVRRATLHFSIDGAAWQGCEVDRYPFEFSVPVADPAAAFRFRVEGETPSGKPFHTAEAGIAALR